ncbi:unnamed protein product [Effrenium voratum]|nr:unnamed protein product [Effrenium voratum]
MSFLKPIARVYKSGLLGITSPALARLGSQPREPAPVDRASEDFEPKELVARLSASRRNRAGEALIATDGSVKALGRQRRAAWGIAFGCSSAFAPHGCDQRMYSAEAWALLQSPLMIEQAATPAIILCDCKSVVQTARRVRRGGRLPLWSAALWKLIAILAPACRILRVPAHDRHPDWKPPDGHNAVECPLWCIFELAAYLKSHEEAEVVLAVVPFDDQIVGSIVLTVLGTSGFYFAGGQFRNFYQEVGTMKAQMKEFRTHKAKAWCCSVNHLDEKGDPMLCDRVIVTKCISAWFGSEKQFEVVVQSKVMHSVLQRLEGMRAFPYLWLVGSFAPIAWGMMDAVAAQLRYGHFQPSMSFTINGANWWLCSMPCLFVFWMTLIQRCHKKSNAKWKEVLVNLAIMLAMSTLFLAFFGVTRAVSALVEDKVLGQVILLVLMAIVTALTFGSQCRRKPVVINPASSEK